MLNKKTLLSKNIDFVSSLTIDDFQTKCEEYGIDDSSTFAEIDNLIFELADLISIKESENN